MKMVQAGAMLHTRTVQAVVLLHTRTVQAETMLHTMAMQAEAMLHMYTMVVQAVVKLHTMAVQAEAMLHPIVVTIPVQPETMLHMTAKETVHALVVLHIQTVVLHTHQKQPCKTHTQSTKTQTQYTRLLEECIDVSHAHGQARTHALNSNHAKWDTRLQTHPSTMHYR